MHPLTHRWQSVAISGYQCRTAAPLLQPAQRLPAISGNQWQSVAISGNQWQSVPDRRSSFSRLSVCRQSVAIGGNQWQSVLGSILPDTQPNTPPNIQPNTPSNTYLIPNLTPHLSKLRVGKGLRDYSIERQGEGSTAIPLQVTGRQARG